MKKGRRILIETKDFRIYEPETFVDNAGHLISLRLCEELVEGRWEPFYAIGKVIKGGTKSEGNNT